MWVTMELESLGAYERRESPDFIAAGRTSRVTETCWTHLYVDDEAVLKELMEIAKRDKQ